MFVDISDHRTHMWAFPNLLSQSCKYTHIQYLCML